MYKYGPGEQAPLEALHRQRISPEKLEKFFKVTMSSIARNSFGYKLHLLANGDIERLSNLSKEKAAVQIFRGCAFTIS